MTQPAVVCPSDIRAFLTANPKLRARDAADAMGISEAQLVAASVGHGTTRVAAHPDRIILAAERLGEVMALTRVGACVHEKVGEYGEYHSGEHAAMTLTENIDLRIFPSHWVHAFALQTQTDQGWRRSLQIFDAAGDAVHKIHLRDASKHEAWAGIVDELAAEDQSDEQAVEMRKPVEGPKSRADKADTLREEWAKLTDTHQFLRLCSKLKMNRLGAYRIADERWVRQLARLPQIRCFGPCAMRASR